MNYVYIYIGEIPDYIKYSINAVLSVEKNAAVYFCTDQDVNFPGCTMVSLKELESDDIKYIKSSNLYSGTTYESNPLWITSLLRLFYLDKIAVLYNLNTFIHFDADILIYEPYEKIQHLFKKNKINITQLTKNQLIFGYCYIDNSEKYSIVVKNVLKVIKDIDYYKKLNFGEPLNEMEILGIVFNEHHNLFNLIPTLPYGDEGYVFDPASYGQYFGGTHQNPRKFFSARIKEQHHIVGNEIMAKRIKPVLMKKQPRVLYNTKSSKIINLHIHSKKLYKYLPVQYKDYIK